jgi:tRNA-binding EMAP/Myf-like protein
VFQEKGVNCLHCGRKGELIVYTKPKNIWLICDRNFIPITLDHIKPKSKGGKNILTNIQPLCYYCNNTKSNNTNEYLVRIKKIIKIKEIPGAENIELIYLNGHKTYAQKSKYKVGDNVVFIEPNSWIPNDLISNYHTAKSNMGVIGWRLKKRKIMGIPVSGMVLPLSILNGIDYEKENLANILNINPYIKVKGCNHIDSINCRHKKLKEKIRNNLPKEVDPMALEIINS